ncbi:hypothetical protein [Evansella clarkii]|uniref:hypothetical protein n=1 Tax=Evansella clarkii TaxID=79879 RepID=UPI0009975604|nr:hypothetical protein [Evansella clarkii]
MREKHGEAANPFLTAFSRQKLVEAVPAESVRLKRKSNNKVTQNFLLFLPNNTSSLQRTG